jgi:Icc-related predicted phosphoesterase
MEIKKGRRNLKITAISDLHGYYPELPGGDLLLLGGDYTRSDQLWQWLDFFQWVKDQKYKKKIMIMGNHDDFLKDHIPRFPKVRSELKRVQSFLKAFGEFESDTEFLSDSGTEFGGLKIWGSPWTPTFPNVNPKCMAYMETESKIEKKFKLIPEDTDILITHGPPALILDNNIIKTSCGSFSLRMHLDKRPKIKAHVFGHIHEQGGKELILKREGFGYENNTRCFNVSHVNENYQPVNKPLTFTL